MSFICTKGLEYIYGGDTSHPIKALNGIDLTINPGEFVAIVGHNGSGKSTLARHFNALLRPTKGQVLVDGLDTRIPSKVFSIRQKVGMVFQNPDNQLVATVVEEEVAFGVENLGLCQREIEERTKRALALVGMEDLSRSTSFHLSRGQKQLLAIAGVLAMEPESIVLDEPTSLLDPEGRKEIIAGLKRLNQEQGMTILLITHFMEDALSAHRILVMDKGRVVLTGKPKEIFSQENRLEELELELPPLIRLVKNLRQRGHQLDPGILSLEELAQELCLSR